MPTLICRRRVFEAFLGCAMDVLLELSQTDHALGRFDRNAHLISIIGAGQVEAMRGRSNRPTQDQPTRSNLLGRVLHRLTLTSPAIDMA